MIGRLSALLRKPAEFDLASHNEPTQNAALSRETTPSRKRGTASHSTLSDRLRRRRRYRNQDLAYPGLGV